MSSCVINLKDIDTTMLARVGGKGANLGELSKMDGIKVPEGFCVTTDVYKEMIRQLPEFDALLEKLSSLKAEDKEVRGISKKIRAAIERAPIEKKIKEVVIDHLVQLGETQAYAVRSSATTEDLASASFAGQQDTYLNIIGRESILTHIRKCWASLFTDRAVIYRIQNGFDHRSVSLAVVIQTMIFPEAAGIMFTADPVTGNRKVVSIDVSFGLGEAVVSGLVNADNYKVRDGTIIEKKISAKKIALTAVKDGGTKEEKIEPERQKAQVLTDEQIVLLERIGRKIEGHFGRPQDIEWCLAGGVFYIVQSRPITTLFPIPERNDQERHVYISTSHQQMMTDAMKPLGISFWQLTAARPMFTAGGRLFVDIAQELASPVKRAMFVNVLGKSDPLIKGALTTIIERNFIPTVPDSAPAKSPLPAGDPLALDNDPTIVSDLIKKNQTSIEELKQAIQTKAGSDLFDFIIEDIPRMKKIIFDPQSSAVFMAAINASAWINEKMQEWLGEKSAADTLTQSVPNNITSEMGLALLDVADVIRPHPKLVAYLEQARHEDDFLDKLPEFEGGKEVQDAIRSYLEKYGMRCVGEIDITKTRWSERPAILLPLILSNIKNFERGAARRKFEQGRQEAMEKEQELLGRLKQLPDGERKAAETKRMIDVVRNFIGYREYPKYGMMSRYFAYKLALLQEAERLLQANIFEQKEDMFYLTFQELHDVVRTQKLDRQLIATRKEEFKLYEKLNPPRVMTSDGEIITAAYTQEHLPAGAIPGLPVSSGIIEGRAHVILNMEDANLKEGDILVTSFTDPSWTPLFVSIKGLVTEVGGLMTHGAVIAREYGLPAVVGVENATKLIQDGQRIRVHGTEGYVEIL